MRPLAASFPRAAIRSVELCPAVKHANGDVETYGFLDDGDDPLDFHWNVWLMVDDPNGNSWTIDANIDEVFTDIAEAREYAWQLAAKYNLPINDYGPPTEGTKDADETELELGRQPGLLRDALPWIKDPG